VAEYHACANPNPFSSNVIGNSPDEHGSGLCTRHASLALTVGWRQAVLA
jgi:hypothetical protein